MCILLQVWYTFKEVFATENIKRRYKYIQYQFTDVNYDYILNKIIHIYIINLFIYIDIES